VARTIIEARPFVEQQTIERPTIVSKRQWMSVEANRNAFINALNKNTV
jgi:hypothetical protein